MAACIGGPHGELPCGKNMCVQNFIVFSFNIYPIFCFFISFVFLSLSVFRCLYLFILTFFSSSPPVLALYICSLVLSCIISFFFSSRSPLIFSSAICFILLFFSQYFKFLLVFSCFPFDFFCLLHFHFYVCACNDQLLRGWSMSMPEVTPVSRPNISYLQQTTILFIQNPLVEHDILKISYWYQHVYVLTYISKIFTGYL
jgi:hypothetical protein